jgi:hypothetical protein
MLSHEGRLLQGRVSYKAQPFRAKLYGFLSYLMRCTVTGDPYTILRLQGEADLG